MSGAWRSLAGVRAVVFDLGGTVIEIDHPRIASYLGEAGCPPPADWVRRAERAGHREVDRLLHAGLPDSEQWRGFWYAYLAAAGAPEEALEPVYRQILGFHLRQHLWNRLHAAMAEAVRVLVRHGLRTAGLSNSDGRAEWQLQRLGVARDYEFVVDSYVAGYEKPDPRIFRAACARLGLAPVDCAYVGDLLSVDVEGAAAAGLRPILMDHYGSYDDNDLPPGVPRAATADELVAGLLGAVGGRVEP